jgi:hypothetical protein
MKPFFLPLNSVTKWPEIGTQVIYLLWKNEYLLFTGEVIDQEKGKVRSSTGYVHYPYLSNVMVSGIVIKAVGIKLIELEK